MIKLALFMCLAIVIGYFIGNINFARIFSKAFSGKDITKVGSKNPGTMNMLRTRNLGEALLTLIFEAIKSGVPALICYFLFERMEAGFGDIAYFSVALAVIVGHCFPVIFKFKGGKGVACTFGMFLFHPTFWWMTLIAFVACFILFLFVKYAFLITLGFCVSMSTCATVFFCLRTPWQFRIPLIILVWLNFLFLIFMHRGNIQRLAMGVENEINFREKLSGKKQNVEQNKTEEDAAEQNIAEETEKPAEEKPAGEEKDNEQK